MKLIVKVWFRQETVHVILFGAGDWTD